MATPALPQCELRLLGAFALQRCEAPVGAGARLIRLPTRKAEALLAYLVLHPSVHSREKLATLFWGDSPEERARGSLRRALTSLRKELGEGLLLADRLTAQFNPAFDLWVDALEFTTQVAAYLAAPDQSSVDLDLYGGDLLADFSDEWIAPLREDLRSDYLRAALLTGRLAERRGDGEAAIAALEGALRVDPAEEDAHRGLMRVYAALGRRNAALEQYVRCERILAEELEVAPSAETIALLERLRARTARDLSPQRPPGSPAQLDEPLVASRELPVPVTSFVGRQQELAQLRAILPSGRLLTLTGPVGGGKTRLALALARGQMSAGAYAHGVCWVDLALAPVLPRGAHGADSLARLILRNLGEADAPDRVALAALADTLGRSAMLLVLDGCAHLVGPASVVVADLLRLCPRLAILVTSPEPLGLPAERIWPVPPLQLPPVRSGPLGRAFIRETETGAALGGLGTALGGYDSVRLFVERAASAWQGFRLTRENELDVARICWRVDGLPLGIEFAATQVRHMPLAQLADELENRLGLLIHGDSVRPGYRMLAGLLAWNYSLLQPLEQALLRRLSVFPGEFTEAEATAICSDASLAPPALEEALFSLVDKSFAQRRESEEGEEYHYRLPSIISEYSGDRLAIAGEAEGFRRAFVDHYARRAFEVAAATGASGDLVGGSANLQRAIAWAVEMGAGGTARVLGEALERLTSTER